MGRREILYWFQINAVPAGGAPENVRAQWVGTVLPVRHPLPVEGPESFIGCDVMDRTRVNAIPDGIAIEPGDALKVLRLFDRHAVAAWWQDLLAIRTQVSHLVFRRHEGRLLPPRMAVMLYPEIDGFDDFDV